MQFQLHYRHRVGHRHVLVVNLTQLELERGVQPKAVMQERLPNIFQSKYLEGLELVETKEGEHVIRLPEDEEFLNRLGQAC